MYDDEHEGGTPQLNAFRGGGRGGGLGQPAASGHISPPLRPPHPPSDQQTLPLAARVDAAAQSAVLKGESVIVLWDTVWNAIEQDPVPTFQKIKPLFLAAMQSYDADWVAGRLDEGIYRQKGERFRRVLTSIIAARTGVTVTARTVDGLTSAHRPDIVVQDRTGEPLLAGEVKMSGTRGHVTPQGVQRPDRGASVDYEKRLKEVKYTSVDLKLRYEGLQVNHWTDWIHTARPPFYVFWACLILGRDRPSRMIQRFDALQRYYCQRVGLFFFHQDDTSGRYAELPHPALMDYAVDAALDEIINIIQTAQAEDQIENS